MKIEIKVPYTTRPSMSRRDGPAFNSSPTGYIRERKLEELNRYGNLLYGVTDTAIQLNLVSKAAKHCGRISTDSIEELSLTFEEDFAIMHNGKLAAVCFCFPSGWVPSSKLGLSLMDIHRPVGDGEHLVKMSDKLASTMADPVLGGFQRYVWTVTNNSGLSNLPGTEVPLLPAKLEDLYFRTEFQTTEPLGDGITSLFFVKVNVTPLLNVWAQYGSNIIKSINSMSEEILKYKNLTRIKNILNNV